MQFSFVVDTKFDVTSCVAMYHFSGFCFSTVPERPPVSASSSIRTMTPSSDSIAAVTGSVPPPYDPVSVQNVGHDGGGEEDYLWLSQCQSHIR